MLTKSKTRRTIKNKKDNCLTVIGINCNGLGGKRDSMLANIMVLNCLVFMVQETKFMKKGLFRVNNFEIFESITSGGGSILTGVHSSLDPIMVSDGSKEEVEILVVEGDIGDRKCRFFNGYGPQETASIDKRINFFAHLEEEIIKAKL